MSEPSPIAREAAQNIASLPVYERNLDDTIHVIPRIADHQKIIQSAIDLALKDYRQYHLTESCKQTKEILDLRAKIERLKGALEMENEARIHLVAQLATANAAAGELGRLLGAARDALRSYQFGNGSPDLANEVADSINAVIASSQSAGTSLLSELEQLRAELDKYQAFKNRADELIEAARTADLLIGRAFETFHEKNREYLEARDAAPKGPHP